MNCEEHRHKKYVLPNLPYLFIFWFFSKVAEGYRLSAGTDMVTKAMGALSGLGAVISQNPLPSFYPRDLLIGAIGAAIVRAVVYSGGKNGKNHITIKFHFAYVDKVRSSLKTGQYALRQAEPT